MSLLLGWINFKRCLNSVSSKQTRSSYLLCSENRFSHNRRSSLLPASSPPPSFQSYLPLSFLICPSFKQPPFSAAEIEQPPIVCFTKQQFSIPLLCVCDWAYNRGDLGGCCVFALFCACPLFVVFCGISLSCNRRYQTCHTHYEHSNLLINLLWLVSDRLARDWWTLAFNESSLTVFYCKSSDIILARTKTWCHIYMDLLSISMYGVPEMSFHVFYPQ